MLKTKVMLATVPMAVLAAGLMAALAAGAAQAETVTLKSNLSGAAEVPPVNSSGKGDATVMVDTASKKATWTIDYSGLSGTPTAAHFHGPAAPGTNAGVAIPIPVSPSPIKGSATLTDAQMADLLAGKDYVNIHTETNKAGEIRGQVQK